MSATNRGSNRRKDDFYETPDWLIGLCLDEIANVNDIYRGSGWSRSRLKILEPCAGNGAVVSQLEYRFPNAMIDAFDINTASNWKGRRTNLITCDFLKEDITEKYDLIITNPPYSLAIDFVEKCLSLSDQSKYRGLVCMLLRLGFLESKSRNKFLIDYTPSVWVTSKRPSFTGNGTDASAYGWFVWGCIYPKVKILPHPDFRTPSLVGVI